MTARCTRSAPLVLALLGACLTVAALASTARAQEAVAPPDPVRDVPLDDLSPGLTGYVLTEGPDGLERFEVELLGVQESDALGRPLLLLRGSGAFLDASGGVAAGMSGSPVYLGADGRERLAGALAYAFPRSDHRLALATPIEAMRALGGPGTEDAGGTLPPGAAPVATPVLLHGLDARAAAHLGSAFDAAGLHPVPVQGGSASADRAAADEDPAPGDAVAALLAWGDVRVAAVGTVTARDGDAVLAFGHPLLRRAEAGYALAAANVLAIVPDSEVPYKLTNVAAAPYGAAFADGAAGIAGRVDGAPAGLPVTIRVEGPDRVRTLAVRLTPDPALAPALLAALVQRAVDETLDAVGGGSADLAWTFEFRDEPELRMLDQRVDRFDLATETARLAAAPLAVLGDNPFRDPELARVALHLDVAPERRHAELVEAALETPEVDPGGTAIAFVRIQPFRAEPEVRTVRVPIPDDAPPGPLRLTFRGASVPDPEVEERTPPPPDPLRQPTSGLPPVLSWGELIAALSERPQARDLLVEMPGEARPRRLQRVDAGAPLLGLERLTVTVRDPDADRSDDAEPAGTADDGAEGAAGSGP